MKLYLIVLSFIAFLLLYFWTGLLWTDYKMRVTTLDDISPITASIPQIKSFLDVHRNESIVIFITPFYHGQTNLTSNKKWITELKNLQDKYNFEIGLHGYKHQILGSRCGELVLPQVLQLKRAREEFKYAFGYYPSLFRGPCFYLDIVDFIYIKFAGMQNYGWLRHGPVYHPSDLNSHT